MKKILGITVLTILLVGTGSMGYAYSTYLSSFTSTYAGTSTSVLNTCGLCHVNPAGGGTRNSYGTAYANAGHNFKTIEPLDSDGDGYTNITEINARTFPGDATSHPGGGTTTCSSFTYGAWGTCTNGTQTRLVASSSPSGCTGGTPVLSQACSTSATCTSFTYNAWGACINGTQARTAASSLPSGCTGGTPVLSQSCTSPSGSCNGNFSGIVGNTGNGATLYGTNCSGCHGSLASSSKKGASASIIWSAINGGISQMTTTKLQALSCQNIADISAALATSTSSTCTSFTYSAWGTCTKGIQTRTVSSGSPSGCTGGSPLLSQSCSGSTGTPGVSGTVKDIVTGVAISGAVVSDGTHSATTNSAGAYTLNEAAGNYTLSITKTGYLTTSQRASVVSGAKATVNWALTKAYGTQAIPAKSMNYVIFAWNDLGMHCDQDDYSHFAVLPPYNTLHAQVFRRGSEGASNVTSGVTVSYVFPKKKNSALHTNFWAYAPQFGWDVPINVGITGTPLAGNMALDAAGKSWQAVGIPITPYDDDGTWDPYGTATITVTNSSTGQVLQTVDVVAPVSTEMMCSNCHGTTNPQLDILQKHDAYNGTTFVADQAKGIVHLCSECHADNALGKAGKAGVENLSLAMHNFHKDKMSYSTQAATLTTGCYNCHPGEKTQCLRGIMARAGKTCTDCHGDMNGMTTSIQNGRQPWLQEPKCGDCHDSAHAENANTLYRNSLLNNAVSGDMNNRIYCEACHNGTHAELTTANPADPTVSKKFQGDSYWIWNCTVCHNATQQAMHRGSATGTGGTTSTGTRTTTDD